MPPNPFIELARDPVGTLALLGYALVLLGVAMASLWWSLRTGAKLVVQWQRRGRTDDWWSGPFEIGVVPPPSWTAWAVAVVFVWAITAWSVSALVWVIGP